MGELVSKFRILLGSFGFRQTLLDWWYTFVLSGSWFLDHIENIKVARDFSTSLEARVEGSYYFSRF